MQNFKLDGRTIAIIAFIVIAAIIFLPRLLGNNGNDVTPTPQPDTRNNPTANPRDTTANQDDGIQLGNVVMTETVDRDGCATDTATSFDTETERIYVVAEYTDVTQGTAVFVRWYLDGAVYEESDEIVADQDYTNTCLAFTLEQDDTNQFRAGDYEAEFIINGNAADTVSFEIQ